MRKPGCEDKICIIVGTVTDDVRLLEVPKLKVFVFCFEISRVHVISCQITPIQILISTLIQIL